MSHKFSVGDVITSEHNDGRYYISKASISNFERVYDIIILKQDSYYKSHNNKRGKIIKRVQEKIIDDYYRIGIYKRLLVDNKQIFIEL